ncbi:MAG: permease, partial [Desulfocapsaceae bacterium]|nr:permease [Desulfocapsaceae bacterium]
MLPAAASFKRQGANRGALASFLVSTPESGFDSIAITYALLDPIMTIVRPVAAFFTGIFAGGLENWFTYDDLEKKRKNSEKEGPVSDNCCETDCDSGEPAAPPPGVISKLIAGLKYGCKDVWGDIVFWFFAGLLIAGVITVLIPES